MIIVGIWILFSDSLKHLTQQQGLPQFELWLTSVWSPVVLALLSFSVKMNAMNSENRNGACGVVY